MRRSEIGDHLHCGADDFVTLPCEGCGYGCSGSHRTCMGAGYGEFMRRAARMPFAADLGLTDVHGAIVWPPIGADLGIAEDWS